MLVDRISAASFSCVGENMKNSALVDTISHVAVSCSLMQCKPDCILGDRVMYKDDDDVPSAKMSCVECKLRESDDYNRRTVR